MTNLVELAEGLSEGERKALLRPLQPWRNWPGKSWVEVGLGLKEKGLIAFQENPRLSATVMTNLGISVRNHLLSQGKEKGE